MANHSLKDYLFLFDIDGTILDTKGAGKKAFVSSFEEINNIKTECDVNFLGGIDNIVFKDLYYSHKLDKKIFNDKWKEFQKQYIKKLSRIKIKDSMILPNAEESLKIFSELSNIALVTGNIQECAYLKLKLFNLNNLFLCGGFGDSACDRKKIVNDAIMESKKIFNKIFNKNNIYLFGDTKKDIDSAKENGIYSILIDHKKIYKNQLNELKPDFYGDFSNIRSLLYIIKNSSKNINQQ